MKRFYLWVLGPLKFQLIITTVTNIETVFMMKVKSKYLAINGSTSDVGGRIFDTSNKNTTSDSKILIPSVTYKQNKIGFLNTKHARVTNALETVSASFRCSLFFR